ncbi:hypothetical protein WJX82_007095 [Trebouxia sp. C0006]
MHVYNAKPVRAPQLSPFDPPDPLFFLPNSSNLDSKAISASHNGKSVPREKLSVSFVLACVSKAVPRIRYTYGCQTCLPPRTHASLALCTSLWAKIEYEDYEKSRTNDGVPGFIALALAVERAYLAKF